MEELQNGKLKVQYLLGELTAEEEHRLDEQFFVNDDYFAELMVTEDELIEDYLRNRLSAAEQRRFEMKLMNSEDLQRKVQLTRLLLKYTDAIPSTLPKNDLAAQEFLSQGLQTYQTCLWTCAITRLVIIGLLWLLINIQPFSNSVEARSILVVFVTVAATYILLELLSLRRSVAAAKSAIGDFGAQKSQ